MPVPVMGFGVSMLMSGAVIRAFTMILPPFWSSRTPSVHTAGEHVVAVIGAAPSTVSVAVCARVPICSTPVAPDVEIVLSSAVDKPRPDAPSPTVIG